MRSVPVMNMHPKKPFFFSFDGVEYLFPPREDPAGWWKIEVKHKATPALDKDGHPVLNVRGEIKRTIRIAYKEAVRYNVPTIGAIRAGSKVYMTPHAAKALKEQSLGLEALLQQGLSASDFAFQEEIVSTLDKEIEEKMRWAERWAAEQEAMKRDFELNFEADKQKAREELAQVKEEQRRLSAARGK